MNHSEFAEWLDYHGTAFPSVGDWITKNRDTISHWERALEDVGIASARAATDAMLCGDLDEPRGYSNHPRAIRRWAKSQSVADETPQRRMVDGEEVYECHWCEDGGTRLSVATKTLKQIVNGEDPETIHWQTMAVACECRAGDRWRRGVKCSGNKPPRKVGSWNGRICFPVEASIPTLQERADCIEWITNGEARAAAMGAEDFGEYGG